MSQESMLIIPEIPALSTNVAVGRAGVDDQCLNDAVTAVRQEIAAILEPIERVFLDMGEHLGDAVTSLRQVSYSFDQVSYSVNSDDLRQASARLADIAARLGDAVRRRDAESAALAQLGGLTAFLVNDLGRLRKTIGAVHLLAMNGRIEAAQVQAEGIDFHVFTDGIGRLSNNAIDLIDGMNDELSRLGGLIELARGDHAGFDHAGAEALPEVERRLSASRAALETRQKDLVSAAQSVSQISRTNENRIAEAIGGLQIGDITRQRLEHVDQALAAVIGAVATETVAVCRLQSLQLGDIHQHGHLALTTVGQQLDAITHGAGSIVATVETIFRTADSKGASFLRQLAGDLETALGLVHQYAEACIQLQRRLEPIVAVVATVRDRLAGIRTLEADMRIMGLNATFKCGRLGSQGRVLAVIAQELRALAGRTADDASRIMAGLVGIADTAQTLSGDGDSGLAPVTEALESSLAAFTHSDQTLTGALDGVDAGVRRCLEGIAAAKGILDNERQVIERLPSCHQSLADVADKLGGGSDLETWRERERQLAEGYSMASQRAIHSHFLGTETTVATGQTMDVDDFLF